MYNHISVVSPVFTTPLKCILEAKLADINYMVRPRVKHSKLSDSTWPSQNM